MKKRARMHNELLSLAHAAPQVVALRMLRMWSAGADPTPADRREWQRMHREKVDALSEGGWAMGWEAARIQQRWLSQWMPFALQPWRWPGLGQDWMHGLPRDGESVLASALVPARKRAVANAKRLGRAPRRR